MVGSFSINHTIEPLYPLWLAVSGAVILFVGGLGQVFKIVKEISILF